MNLVSIYSWNKEGNLNISIQTTSGSCILDMRGSHWVDSRFGLFKSLSYMNDVSIWDTDLVAHDDYIASVANKTVLLVVGDKGVSASRKRMLRAYNKLRADKSVKKVKYFASRTSLNKYLEKNFKK